MMFDEFDNATAKIPEVIYGIGFSYFIHWILPLLRWLERVLVFHDAIYLGVEIFRLDFANHGHILPHNNDNIKVLIFCGFLKKFVSMATQLGFEV